MKSKLTAGISGVMLLFVLILAGCDFGSLIDISKIDITPEINPTAGTNPIAPVVLTDDPFGTRAIYDVAYGNGKFVAVGPGKIAYSEDGVNWAIASVTPSEFHCITYGGGKFVAGGVAAIVYSEDGVTWTTVSVPLSTRYYVPSIGYGDGKFIACGHRDNINYGVVCSEDGGVTWTGVTVPNDIRAMWSNTAISYGDGKFITGGGDGSMAYSPDGITWTAISHPFPFPIYDCIYVDEKFVAVGYGVYSGRAIAFSEDGVTWTDVPTGNLFIHHIAYGDGKFLAVIDDNKLAFSTDGVTLTAVFDSTFGTSKINGIAYGDGKFVIVGADGKIAYFTYQE